MSDLEAGKDVSFEDSYANNYCVEIIIQGGGRTRAIHLNRTAGTYTIDSKI